jgi:hypothetical protein
MLVRRQKGLVGVEISWDERLVQAVVAKRKKTRRLVLRDPTPVSKIAEKTERLTYA